MIVVLDSSVLLFLLEPHASAPLDPSTGKPVDRCSDRVNRLVADLSAKRAKIIVPAPVLAEILVNAGSAGPGWLKIIGETRSFRVVPFDARAAVEFASRQSARKAAGKRADGPRAKAKFDDQIISIAHVEGASVIYSSDEGLARLAAPDIEVLGIADLPLPPQDAQMSFGLEPRSEEDATSGPFG